MRRRMGYRAFLVWLLLAVAPAGVSVAASAPPDEGVAEILAEEDEPADSAAEQDPWQPLNRAIYRFNRLMDAWIVGPITHLYMAVMPATGQTMVHNALSNLSTPMMAVNQLIQGDPDGSIRSLWRFTINSTLGVGGLNDIAAAAGLKPVPTDLGLTMARYCVPQGPYLMLPILGPTTLRDGLGGLGDLFLDPFNYTMQREAAEIRFVIVGIDKRREVDGTLQQIDASSFDPYVTIRSMYLQSRQGTAATFMQQCSGKK